jgi:DNA polymerase III epsilon subunit-like protein
MYYNQTTQICKLKQKINYTDKSTGKQKFFYKLKSPKLSEAYEHFFGYSPAGEALHDALVDVVVCLRVYLKYNSLPDVCGKNTTITNYIMDISPPGYTCPEPTSEGAMAGGKKRKNKRTKNRNHKQKRSKKTRKYRK